MKVLVTEKIAESGLDLLRGTHEVVVATGLDEAGLCEAIVDADALIIRSATQVTAPVFAAAKQLKVVGRAGIGVDNVDVPAATAHGVIVVNAPQSNVVSAAEHAMALLLAEARNVARADASLRDGKWERSKFSGVELYGKTLGLLGLGRVGGLVAERCAGFGMRLVAYDPFVSEERARALGCELVASPDALYERADFITIHLPRNAETEGMINADAIAKMRDGVRIVNTARGGIIDEAALADALTSGRVGGAGIDVFDTEPCTDSPLFRVPEAVVTPHLGASTDEAQERAGTMIAEYVMAALAGEFVSSAVNVDIGANVSKLVRDHLAVGEALGRFFAAYAGGVGASIEVEYVGEIADEDTRALGLSVVQGLFAKAVDEPVTLVNAPILARERGLDLRETKTSKPREYTSLVTVRGTIGGRPYSVSGVLSDRGTPRIVQVGDYEVETTPSPFMAIISNDDRPGVIGRVGMALGDASVNIRDMVVGRHLHEPFALMGIVSDGPVAADVQAAIRSVPGVLDARFLEL